MIQPATRISHTVGYYFSHKLKEINMHQNSGHDIINLGIGNPDLMPLIGSKEGIFHISLAFLNPGDKVLLPNSGYLSYQSVSRPVFLIILLFQLIFLIFY